MKLRFNYLESDIDLEKCCINVIEVENKSYFYRMVNGLNLLSLGEPIEEINFYDDLGECYIAGKINIVTDYFDFDFNEKKYSSNLVKIINKEITEIDENALSNIYKKMQSLYNKVLINIDLPLSSKQEFTTDTIFKMLKISIDKKEKLLENLLLLLDLEKNFNIDKLVVFVNLKQYLSKEDLIEVYKYSIYNNVTILLIDSQTYGPTISYERKLIIDETLDEFVLQ